MVPEEMLTNSDNVLFGIKVNGKLINEKYVNRILAEQAKLNLPENERLVAEIVAVTEDGKELLLG